jgi:superfamily I DNA/RNA helicase
MAEAGRIDPTQRAAATDDAPVQLTLAGPGAGKTTTLAVRFVHLVRQGVDPRRITQHLNPASARTKLGKH